MLVTFSQGFVKFEFRKSRLDTSSPILLRVVVVFIFESVERNFRWHSSWPHHIVHYSSSYCASRQLGLIGLWTSRYSFWRTGSSHSRLSGIARSIVRAQTVVPTAQLCAQQSAAQVSISLRRQQSAAPDLLRQQSVTLSKLLLASFRDSRKSRIRASLSLVSASFLFFTSFVSQ